MIDLLIGAVVLAIIVWILAHVSGFIAAVVALAGAVLLLVVLARRLGAGV